MTSAGQRSRKWYTVYKMPFKHRILVTWVGSLIAIAENLVTFVTFGCLLPGWQMDYMVRVSMWQARKARDKHGF